MEKHFTLLEALTIIAGVLGDNITKIEYESGNGLTFNVNQLSGNVLAPVTIHWYIELNEAGKIKIIK